MNSGECTLAALRVGECAVVTGIRTEDGMRRRLWDMGVVVGTGVQCVFRSPSGDPTAYAVRGTVIALRRCDAATVAVKRKAVSE